MFSCGFDSLPFELGAFFVQKEAKRVFGAAAARGKGRVREMRGTLSGGTAASAKATFDAVAKDLSLVAILNDPFALTPGFTGARQPRGNKPIYDEDSERTLLDVMASQKTSDPEELVVTQEVSDDIRQRIRQNLSELESQVLESYLEGKSYQEMARDLGRHVKSIDNALQRVKRKIEKNLAEFEFQKTTVSS